MYYVYCEYALLWKLPLSHEPHTAQGIVRVDKIAMHPCTSHLPVSRKRITFYLFLAFPTNLLKILLLLLLLIPLFVYALSLRNLSEKRKDASMRFSVLHSPQGNTSSCYALTADSILAHSQQRKK